MILFSIIFVMIIILIQIFLTISIKIEIINLKLKLPTKDKAMTNKDNKIYLKVYLLNKIRILKIDLKKLNKKNKNITNRVRERAMEDGFNINTINFFKNNNYILEKMNLKIEIGTEDAGLTAIGFGILCTFISNILNHKITDINLQSYEIIPIYNKNVFRMNFDGIFTFKMANIIGIIKYLRKRSVYKNGRTSYRGSYAYSNE